MLYTVSFMCKSRNRHNLTSRQVHELYATVEADAEDVGQWCRWEQSPVAQANEAVRNQPVDSHCPKGVESGLDHDVAEMEVPVHVILLVQEVQALEDLEEDRLGQVEREVRLRASILAVWPRKRPLGQASSHGTEDEAKVGLGFPTVHEPTLETDEGHGSVGGFEGPVDVSVHLTLLETEA